MLLSSKEWWFGFAHPALNEGWNECTLTRLLRRGSYESMGPLDDLELTVDLNRWRVQRAESNQVKWQKPSRG